MSNKPNNFQLKLNDDIFTAENLNENQQPQASKKSIQDSKESADKSSSDTLSESEIQELYVLDNLKDNYSLNSLKNSFIKTKSFESDIESPSINSFDCSSSGVRLLGLEISVNNIKSPSIYSSENNIEAVEMSRSDSSLTGSTSQSSYEIVESKLFGKNDENDLNQSLNFGSDLSLSVLLPEQSSEKVENENKVEQTGGSSEYEFKSLYIIDKTVTVCQVLKELLEKMFIPLLIFFVFSFVEGFNIFVCFAFFAFFDLFGSKLAAGLKKMSNF